MKQGNGSVFLPRQTRDPFLNIPRLVEAVQSVQATLSTRRDVLKKTFDVWEDRKDAPPAPKSSQVRLRLFVSDQAECLPYVNNGDHRIRPRSSTANLTGFESLIASVSTELGSANIF